LNEQYTLADTKAKVEVLNSLYKIEILIGVIVIKS